MNVVSLPIDANAAIGVDLSNAIRSAAAGDIAVQRQMRDDCLETMRRSIAQGSIAEAHAYALEAMFWARLVASHGTDDDAMLLAATLAYLAEFWGFDQEDAPLGNDMLSEAFSIIDRVASNGSEDAACALNFIAGEVAPHILKHAREMVDVGC
ncbi:hypothetical protein WG908_06345 [Sphingobium sp. AN641]|uniref:hypothetical protein n=1 Tax=Sphingobium sp. AN641 TaxID=3133443 RepID=UPI0030BA5533